MSFLPARQRHSKCFLLSSPCTCSTRQKTGRNYGVSHRDINRGFYHLFSLQLLPSCRKFAQISEGRTGTAHVNCPLMSMPYITQQKPAPVSPTVLSLTAYFAILSPPPMNIPSFPTFLCKRFESFLPGPGARVMAIAWPMQQCQARLF